MRSTRFHLKPALLLLGILGLFAVCFYGLHGIKPATRTSKTFAHDLADSVRIWDPKTGLDCVRIKSCRLEKRKMGPVTLGGLNILILEDVVLNLPLPDDIATNLASSTSSPSGWGNHGPASLRQKPQESPLGFLTTIIPKSLRASGIRIGNLTVNRVGANRHVTPVFTAAELRNRGKALLLSGCRVVNGTQTNFVGEGTLTFTPKARLSWNDGELPLDDLISSRQDCP
jgi:hypothetical protein